MEVVISPGPVFGAAAHGISAVHNWHKKIMLAPAYWELRETALAKATGSHFQFPFDLWTTKSFPVEEQIMYNEFKPTENTSFCFIFVYHWNPPVGPTEPNLSYLLLAHCLPSSPTDQDQFPSSTACISFLSIIFLYPDIPKVVWKQWPNVLF